MNPPSITISGLYVKVAWIEPVVNFQAIKTYTILMKDSIGLYSEQKAICDGSKTSTISNLYCMIEMSKLRASPLSLLQS
jgi:hypothetical protein